MVLAGIFAPFNATPLMTQVFGASRLKEIKQLLVIDLNLDMPEFHDSSVIGAIRLRMKDRVDQALDALCVMTDRKLHNLFEQFLLNLPKIEDPPSAEETLVNNFISPILRAFLQRTEDNIVAHFPNTDSSTQKKQGVSPDLPDFKLCIGKREIAFGEITGHQQKADKSKNGIDLWRLARFGKSVLDEGAPKVPLVQIIYEQGTVYRLVVRTRGIMVLAEVGVFTIPMHMNAIGSFQASMQVLEWFRVKFDASKLLLSFLVTWKPTYRSFFSFLFFFFVIEIASSKMAGG
ncbi:MAG: hypothetical protein BYD32DRAFT_151745 [Podila humilis]|nr:MAG: hypothetical protein BYD32DRAFT_151745 [Podila humilis]